MDMMQRNMQLQDWLDDLCVRFLMNGPKEDLETAERICFRVEEAQWYYEDFIRPQDPSLPSMTLKSFCEQIFAHCPLLLPFSQDHRMKAFDAFLNYKKRVPVRGAIMLNQDMDQLVLVKGWKKGANWSFPRGKINKDEDDLDCAIREVYEETGYDLGESGLVPMDRKVKSIELNMHEQQIRLFVFRGIPMDTHFEPRTRKEISAIEWWQLSDLPAFRKGKAQAQQPIYKATNFYMVAPFLAQIRKWINEQKKQDAINHLDYGDQSTVRLGQDEMMSEGDQVANLNIKAIYGEASMTNTRPSERESAGLDHNIDGIRHDYHTQDQTQDPYSNKTGSALLALLNSQANTARYQQQKDLPQTPIGHKFLQTHASGTSHQALKNFSISGMLTPSKFPVHKQSEEPDFHQQHSIKNTFKSMIETQNYGQRHQQNFTAGPHSHQPQHLIHPQPLPPNVQRTVFVQSPAPAYPLLTKPASYLDSAFKMPPENPQNNQHPYISHQPQELPASPPQLKPHQFNHYLSKASVPLVPEAGIKLQPSNNYEYYYNPQIYSRQNVSVRSDEELLSSFHCLPNDSMSQMSTSNLNLLSGVREQASHKSNIRRGSKPISPSDEGFLFSYLDAVVARGTKF